MPDFDYARYYLAQADSERIFARQIVPQEIAGRAVGVERPTVVFVGGQPGSGKTKLTKAVCRSLEEVGGYVPVNSDTYKPYHPSWSELLRRDDTTAAPYTAMDGRRWMSMAEQHAAGHRMNIVLETTFRDPGVFDEPVRRLRGSGYRVEVAVLAVHEATSHLGILSRYAMQVRQNGHGRLTETANHDECYRLVGDVLRAQDAAPDVDVLSVWSRSGLLYANVATDGRWVAPGRAATVLDQERTRTWTYPEAVDFLRTAADLSRTLPHDLRDRVDHVRELAVPRLPAGADAVWQASVDHPQVRDPLSRRPSTDERLAALRGRSVDPDADDVRSRLRDVVAQAPQDEPPVVGGPSGLQMWVHQKRRSS